jgi:hypothetical protein
MARIKHKKVDAREQVTRKWRREAWARVSQLLFSQATVSFQGETQDERGSLTARSQRQGVRFFVCCGRRRLQNSQQ